MAKKLNITINFDMDGTLCGIYDIEGWLAMLEAEDPTPYMVAKPLIRLATLARTLNALQRNGYDLAIVSWLSKHGTEAYDMAVTEAKLNWLAKHMPSVQWDKIHIVPYGTPKQNFCDNPLDILFDDEEPNRNNWTGRAYGVDDIMGVLRNI